MSDQAERLRQIVSKLKREKEASSYPAMHACHVIAITSGKGGVGKTNFTVNFAIALARLGKKVIVFDADLGLANIDVLLGSCPVINLGNVIKGEAKLQNIIMEGPEGIKIVPGGSGLSELTNLDAEEINGFVREIIEIENTTDYLLIDTGAGLAKDVMSFVLAANEIFVLSTADPTSITDAYATIKYVSLVNRTKDLQLVVNAVDNQNDADQVARKLAIAAKQFLGIELAYFGFVYNDNAVTKAVREQKPFVISYPRSEAAKCIYNLAAKLSKRDAERRNSKPGKRYGHVGDYSL